MSDRADRVTVVPRPLNDLETYNPELVALSYCPGFVAAATNSTVRILAQDSKGRYDITRVLRAHKKAKKRVNSVCIIKIGSDAELAVASASNDGKIRMFDMEGFERDVKHGYVKSVKLLMPSIVLTGHTDSVTCVQPHPFEPWICSSSKDGKVKLWNVMDEKTSQYQLDNVHWNWEKEVPDFSMGTLSGRDDAYVTCCAWTKDYIISGARDKQIRVWDAVSNLSLVEVCCRNPVNCLDLFGVNVVVAGVGDNGKLIIIDTRQPGEAATKVNNGHKLGILSVKCLAGTNYFATGGSDSVVNLWDLRKDEVIIKELHLGADQEVNCVGWTEKKEVLAGDSSSLIVSRSVIN